jgi:hypothetical protein
LGVLDLKDIEIKGEAIEDVMTEFELPSTFKHLKPNTYAHPNHIGAHTMA